MTHNQEYHEWDCWAIHDPEDNLFHSFRLYAHQKYKDSGQHDKFSRLVYARSSDLIEFERPIRDIIKPQSESSVWTGCIIRHPHGYFQLFYTERSTTSDYWAIQSIRVARAEKIDSGEWKTESMSLTPESVDPEEVIFQRKPGEGDRTIHSWRDPYVFGYAGRTFMLLAANLKTTEKGSKNACIALLEATSESLLDWCLVQESLITGYEELEVPQLYIDERTNEAVLIASTWDESDYNTSKDEKEYNPYENLPGTCIRTRGYLLEFRAKSFSDVLASTCKFSFTKNLVQPDEKFYAGIIVPELNGSILGFEVGDEGKSKLLGERCPNLKHPDPSLRTTHPSN
jgi:beta-fructofuranosidase